MAERSKALVSGTSLFGGEGSNPSSVTMSRLAQLVERKTLNLVVVGSSPTSGALAVSGAAQTHDVAKCPGFKSLRLQTFSGGVAQGQSVCFASGRCGPQHSFTHQWFSGKMNRCHRFAPGSIPG